jgi:signal transduction histidine kinase
MAVKQRNIRKKLIVFVILILTGSIAGSCFLSGILGVIGGQSRFIHIKNRIEGDLHGKGMTLVVNNGIALRSMAEDNAYSAIREAVVATVQSDSDVAYGIYMDDKCHPWVMAFSKNGTISFENRPLLEDSISMWAHALTLPDSRIIPSKDGVSPIIEFASPVFSEESIRRGVIRYGISTARMYGTILTEKRNVVRETSVNIIISIVVSLGVFFLGAQAAKRQAHAITKPIIELTEATKSIVLGDYSAPLKVVSNDEIGILADNFDKMRTTVKEYTSNLESMVSERTKELKAAQKDLVEKAHKAGMADIAAGTLHNVGNILNSVRVSIEVISATTNDLPLQELTRANGLLRENMDKIETFILDDPRGKKLLLYYLQLEEPFKNANATMQQNIQRLIEKVNTISDVIAAQQNYAGVGGLTEKVKLTDVIEDALLMQSGSIGRHKISVVKEYHDAPEILVQKTKLVHILVNLIKNAKDAMIGLDPGNKKLYISVQDEDGSIVIRVKDAGCGIRQENIKKIFSYGFSTKKDGHGFGLHSSVNYMKEMGGEMWAESEGEGKGAQFVLKFSKKLSTA